MTTSQRQAINPAGIRKPYARYSHGVLAPAGGRLLVTSGQLGVSADDTHP